MTEAAAKDILESTIDAASPTERPRGPGLFVAVVGPSGAGKDSLLNELRRQLAGNDAYYFPRRLITRPADGATEDHDSLSVETLEAMIARGDVALFWRAHGLAYALPTDVDRSVADGQVVIANVSRRVVRAARQRYARVLVLVITAPIAVLAERLAARGREGTEEIRRRLQRADLSFPADAGPIVTIENTGTIDAGAAAMLAAINTAARTLG